MKSKVILAMSGGVDSSVAALLLKKQGYKVIGVFMKNFSDTKNESTGECSWREEKRIAQKIAMLLNIPLLAVDYEKQYKKNVIEPMFKSYAQGLTPNPDTLCNKTIKFPLLRKLAKKLKAEHIATGHYARIKKTRYGFQLLKAKDKTKDQSYFLYGLSQKDLSNVLFPVGDLTKEQVRSLAKKNHFPNWNKKGTSGICFVGKVDIKSFLKKRIKEKPGKILSPENEEIGAHPGAMFFTIGERVREKKGLKISKRYQQGKKLYISAKKKNNILLIAPENHPSLFTKKVFINSFHLINKKDFPKTGIKARIRHLGELVAGTLSKKSLRYFFTFKKPQEGVAEGQVIVLYNKEKLVGGGEIRLA